MQLIIGGSAGSNAPLCPRQKYGHLTTSFGLIDTGEKIGIIVDNGTGVQFVSRRMVEEQVEMFWVLQTHFHEDHISGLQLNTALFSRKIQGIFAPNLGAVSFEEVFAERFRPAIWPISPATFGISHQFSIFKPGETLEIGPIRVESFLLHHPGGAVGYRFFLPDGDIVLASDNELSGDVEDYAHFVAGARILLADVQYRQAEYDGEQQISGSKLTRHDWGHSTPKMLADALAFCEEQPRQVIITHHDPGRSDADLDGFHREALELLPGCQMARCGEMIEL